MARKQGGVNKFLNFIGLVDAEPQTAVDDYADNYGRPSTYVPKQQRSRTEDTRRRTIVKDERGRYGADRYASTRVTPPASRRTSSAGYDYNYVPRDTRSSYEPASTRAQTRAQRQRTLMCSLNTLEDCCDVIDSLIAGNVVVLTLDEIDPKLTQRAIDTLSGAVFALNATIRKASDRTYVLAPNTVEVNETYDVERRF